jgi:hypothetical protein
MAARRRGRPDHDSYLRNAAARIDELVLGSGVHRPVCYVFGHTHVEALTELAGGDAWYANTGTWSRHVRHDAVLHRFPFLVVGRSAGGRPTVRLDYWDSALRKVVCPAVADGGYRRLADTFRP